MKSHQRFWGTCGICSTIPMVDALVRSQFWAKFVDYLGKIITPPALGCLTKTLPRMSNANPLNNHIECIWYNDIENQRTISKGYQPLSYSYLHWFGWNSLSAGTCKPRYWVIIYHPWACISWTKTQSIIYFTPVYPLIIFVDSSIDPILVNDIMNGWPCIVGNQRHLGLCLGCVPALADQGTTLRASDLNNALATILNPFITWNMK